MSDPNVEVIRAIAAQCPNDPAVQELLGTAERVINKARLERIATAVLAGFCACPGITVDLGLAVTYARALIAEIDKEEKP